MQQITATFALIPRKGAETSRTSGATLPPFSKGREYSFLRGKFLRPIRFVEIRKHINDRIRHLDFFFEQRIIPTFSKGGWGGLCFKFHNQFPARGRKPRTSARRCGAGRVLESFITNSPQGDGNHNEQPGFSQRTFALKRFHNRFPARGRKLALWSFKIRK